MKGKFNIIILDSAHKNRKEIYNFCSNVSIDYALKIRCRINESINSLKYFPFANPLYAVIENLVFRKKIVDKRYIIIFSIIQNNVYIYNIIDGRKDIKPTDLFK